jgi:hypothetical protein
MGQIGGFSLADMLASFALFDDNPAHQQPGVRIRQGDTRGGRKTAQECLRCRTVWY